jgi:predicted GNAT family N-acyltransferase
MNNTMLHTITSTNWQTHAEDLIKIRTKVFMQEQQVSAADEWDGLDEQATHFLALSATGVPIGCARLLIEITDEHRIYHIGRVAILKAFRNLGIGHHLMEVIIEHCKKTAPENSIYLHAQTERRHFYETLDFVAQGSEFMDAGIPHISMYLAQ